MVAAPHTHSRQIDRAFDGRDICPDTHRQVVPQLALPHLQRGLRQVRFGNREPWDGVVEVETEGDQPDVYICRGREKQMGRVMGTNRACWRFHPRGGWTGGRLRKSSSTCSERLLRTLPAAPPGPAASPGVLRLLEGPTCDILFDVMDLADGVVTPKHVQVEGLRVFSHAGPPADVGSGPPGGENPIRTERGG